jgi:hypothetical protein
VKILRHCCRLTRIFMSSAVAWLWLARFLQTDKLRNSIYSLLSIILGLNKSLRLLLSAWRWIIIILSRDNTLDLEIPKFSISFPRTFEKKTRENSIFIHKAAPEWAFIHFSSHAYTHSLSQFEYVTLSAEWKQNLA